MGELLENIFTAGKPAHLVADTKSHLPSRRHEAWDTLRALPSTRITIVEATGSTEKSAHNRGWGVLRRIQRSGGCIGFDSSTAGGSNNRALIRVDRIVEYVSDCGGCSAAKTGCPINNAMANAHRYSRQPDWS
ncbi:hypothetical protein KBC80_02455 [Candidatus Woesebacteria bacterium]|nr:hypothetical protein [Candidatus Woesebacteria bacterium]